MEVEATPNQQQQKKTLGRRKIEIKKVESRRARYVNFSKRRASLFRKASDLSIICGAEIALVVLSCAGKVFTFGDLDAVAAPYLDHIDRAIEEEEEEADGATTEQQQQEEKGGFWWESIEIESKSIEELKELASRLAAKKEELVKRLTEFIFPNPTCDVAAMADVAIHPVSEQCVAPRLLIRLNRLVRGAQNDPSRYDRNPWSWFSPQRLSRGVFEPKEWLLME